MSMEDVANTDHFNIIEQLIDGEYHLTKVRTTEQNKKVVTDVSVGTLSLIGLHC